MADFKVLYDMIGQRKSFRKYKDIPVDEEVLAKVLAFIKDAKALYPEINVDAEILGREHIRTLMTWMPQQCIAIYSTEHEWDLENVGFIFQQVDLYIQSLGLGSCWVGLGRPKGAAVKNKENDEKFVILLTIGHPDETLRTDVSQFKRKSLSEISDTVDEALEPARLAPSAVNSQPWYFLHEDGIYHLFRTKPRSIKGRSLNDFNRMDVGIVLAHMYVAHPDTFSFFRGDHPEWKNGIYIGSFTI
ncbi:MAG: nitroreductase [Firmicutes bacterium]|nr:nitroreductase [Bacillota bacterium]